MKEEKRRKTTHTASFLQKKLDFFSAATSNIYYIMFLYVAVFLL